LPSGGETPVEADGFPTGRGALDFVSAGNGKGSVISAISMIFSRLGSRPVSTSGFAADTAIATMTMTPATACTTTEPATGACLRTAGLFAHRDMPPQNVIARDYARAMRRYGMMKSDVGYAISL
jgi:hypothetical protein